MTEKVSMIRLPTAAPPFVSYLPEVVGMIQVGKSQRRFLRPSAGKCSAPSASPQINLYRLQVPAQLNSGSAVSPRSRLILLIFSFVDAMRH